MAQTIRSFAWQRTIWVVVPAEAAPRAPAAGALGRRLRIGTLVGALAGLVMAAAIADPADLLVHVSNVMRMMATGAIAGGCAAGMFSTDEA